MLNRLIARITIAHMTYRIERKFNKPPHIAARKALREGIGI